MRILYLSVLLMGVVGGGALAWSLEVQAGHGAMTDFSSSDSPVSGQPNVIWIMIDTLRPDHLSLAGYFRDTTPHIRILAQGGVVFRHAYSASSWTLPSVASMLSGLHAFHHEYILPSVLESIAYEAAFLPRSMADAGYHTVSIQTNPFVTRLDVQFMERINLSYLSDVTIDEKAVDAAIDWLDSADGTAPFMLFMGLIGPHWPYYYQNSYFEHFVLAPSFDGLPHLDVGFSASTTGLITSEGLPEAVLKKLTGSLDASSTFYTDSRVYTAAYDADIAYTDEQLGRFFDYLKSQKRYEETLIVICSDHGEHLADRHPYYQHGCSLFNALIHVPLIIKFPKQTEPMRIDANVRNVDILPTIMAYAGIPADAVDGRSLLPLVEMAANQAVTDADGMLMQALPILAYHVRSDNAMAEVAFVKRNHKLIKAYDRDYLFDLRFDPHETRDLGDDSNLIDILTQDLTHFYSY